MLLESTEEEFDLSAEKPTPPSPILQENYLVFPLFSSLQDPKSQSMDYKIVDLNAVKKADSIEHDKISANELEVMEDTPKTQWQELSIYASSLLTKKELDSPCQFDTTESEPGTPWKFTQHSPFK